MFIRYMLMVALLSVSASAFGTGVVKQPTRAALYSALVPGAGQVYNQAYIKAGIVIGIQGYLLGSAFYHNAKVEDYTELTEQTSNSQLAAVYRTRRQEYREMRTSDIWWMGITMGLSVLDAWVDAHLYDFDAEKDKVHLRFEEDMLKLEYKF